MSVLQFRDYLLQIMLASCEDRFQRFSQCRFERGNIPPQRLASGSYSKCVHRFASCKVVRQFQSSVAWSAVSIAEGVTYLN